MATITAACGSMSGTYRAESLSLLLPDRVERVEDADVSLLIGPLTKGSDVVRVLGSRAGRLFANAIILQARITAGSSAVKVSSGSLKLRLPTGEALRPLGSEEVLAAISLPEHGWAKRDVQTTDPYAVLIELGVSGLGFVIEEIRKKSATERYWEAARPDVEKKTMLPREIRPGESLGLLVVFLPKTGKRFGLDALTLTAEFTVNGENWKKDLVVGLK